MTRCLAALGALVLAAPLAAQSFPTDDPVLPQIWAEGMERSRAADLAQVLMDSIGPRLTGTPGQQAANAWAVSTYGAWGVQARAVPYGTWRGWRRGITHVDLVSPRVRSLEATMLAWSPGTKGTVVEGAALVLPDVADSAAFAAWLPQAKGRFVLISVPQPTCRPDSSVKAFAKGDAFDRMVKERRAQREAWDARLKRTGLEARDLPVALERAGAKGVVTSTWSGGWGVTRIFGARTERVPTLDLSCEDYGLVFRLAERRQSPVLRVRAEAEFLGEVPVANVIAEIRGVERPDEYVILSAHFDSWDGGSGATDNGTGTITMMEAMRILRQVYPRPKRTILVGHWGGEEQGLNGSRAWAADNPKVVEGLQALFNQDNGTGRIVSLSAQGFTGAGAFLAKWLSRVPRELNDGIDLGLPGAPGRGGTDNASFVCYGAPAFNLGSLHWEYFTYTWHTNRDTYDKVMPEELRQNATLAAMLAYLASEDPERVPRDRRVLTGQGPAAAWPTCSSPARTSQESTR